MSSGTLPPSSGALAPTGYEALSVSARAVNAVRVKRAVNIIPCVLLALGTVVACVLFGLAAHHALGNVRAFIKLHPGLPECVFNDSEWKNNLSPQDWSKLSAILQCETGFTIGAAITGILGVVALGFAGVFVALGIEDDKSLRQKIRLQNNEKKVSL